MTHGPCPSQWSAFACKENARIERGECKERVRSKKRTRGGVPLFQLYWTNDCLKYNVHERWYFAVEGNKWLPIFEMCRLMRKNHSMYEIKTLYYVSLQCIKKLTRSLRSLVIFFNTSQLVNKNSVCVLSME